MKGALFVQVALHFVGDQERASRSAASEIASAISCDSGRTPPSALDWLDDHGRCPGVTAAFIAADRLPDPGHLTESGLNGAR